MKVFDQNSTELIAELRKQKRDEILSHNQPENSSHTATYRHTTNYLINLVEKEYLINDKEINDLIYSINKRLNQCNPSIKPIKKILIKKDGFLNAASYGEGTMTLNIGLLASLEYEEELAFIMAHEIAHYHLNHLRTRIDKHTRKESSSPVMKRINKIPEGKMTLEDLQYVQSWFKSLFKNSIQHELEADSLAMIMIKNCGLNSNSGLKTLNYLRSVYYPSNPLERKLFDEFIFDELPFKRRWLDTKRVQQNNNLLTHLLNVDSISTHPDIR
ncbi:M48 family metalloprotease [Ekhidna sp.]